MASSWADANKQAAKEILNYDFAQKAEHDSACFSNFYDTSSPLCKVMTTEQLKQFKQDTLLNYPSYKPKTFMDKFNDPETGYKKFARDLWGEEIASWTTDPFADAVKGADESFKKIGEGNYLEGSKQLVATGAEAVVGSRLKKIPGVKKFLKKTDGVGIKGRDCDI